MTNPLPCALPDTPLAAMSAGLDACVHCGFCLQACPTYVNLEDENDSPRGRIVLMSRMLTGEIALDDEDAGRHLDRCLGCRACETACPSGVPYGELLEATRATTAAARGTPFIAKVVLGVFRRRALLSVVLTLAKGLRATRLPLFLARILPPRLAFPFAMLASTRSPLQSASFDRETRAASSSSNENATNPSSTSNPSSTPSTSPTNASIKHGVTTLLEGCVMRGLFRHVNNATERALTVNGFTVVETADQHCCGALHAHAGDLEGARELARLNIAAFERSAAQSGVDSIAINSAGCGAMVKQYGHLLSNDPEWCARAEHVSSMAQDASELLFAAGPRKSNLQGLELAPGRNASHTSPPAKLRVAHDPPCHQMHAQRVVKQPVAVLNSIDGIDLIPLEDADQCCGSAGIYNLLEPDTSDAVLKPKLQRIAECRVELLATGNPGCMMQIGAGLLLSGSRTRVVHPVELLDAGYTVARHERPSDHSWQESAK